MYLTLQWCNVTEENVDYNQFNGHEWSLIHVMDIQFPDMGLQSESSFKLVPMIILVKFYIFNLFMRPLVFFNIILRAQLGP